MAEALIYEFDDVSRDAYDAVNEALGLDLDAGTGDWPSGIKAHVGAAKPGGGWVVFEVWDSQADQQRWMDQALQQTGVPAPSRLEWLDVAGYVTPGA